MTPVLQSRLPAPLWCDRSAQRLPGIQPLAPLDWLWVDGAFSAQMALRDTLIAQRADDVLACEPAAHSAAQEVLEHVLTALAGVAGYNISADAVSRPDGVLVSINRQNPLATAGRLVQEDLCLMQKPDDGGEHVLTGAVLCFPAGWTLREKINRPLWAIHKPVASYDQNVALRVQRLFDAIRIDQPLVRVNGFYYESPTLFAPYSEASPRPRSSTTAKYFRAERQCLVRLPKTNAVVFSIHTFMIERENLSREQVRIFREKSA